MKETRHLWLRQPCLPGCYQPVFLDVCTTSGGVAAGPMATCAGGGGGGATPAYLDTCSCGRGAIPVYLDSWAIGGGTAAGLMAACAGDAIPAHLDTCACGGGVPNPAYLSAGANVSCGVNVPYLNACATGGGAAAGPVAAQLQGKGELERAALAPIISCALKAAAGSVSSAACAADTATCAATPLTWISFAAHGDQCSLQMCNRVHEGACHRACACELCRAMQYRRMGQGGLRWEAS
eukprot:scaffold95422_cov22-Tisochrysis_lutea.AAC.1